MSTSAEQSAAEMADRVPPGDGFRSDRAGDRMMRRILGVTHVDPGSGRRGHHAFRTAVIVSALRCTVTYLAIPILVPILSIAGWIASPIGIALCGVAAVNGVISVRRFWRADHRYRWTYTIFIALIFVILTISTITELARMGVTP